MRVSQVSSSGGSPCPSRAFSAGKQPGMPALHWAMTNSGFCTMKSGAPKAGMRRFRRTGGRAISAS